jgi:hypothetical protein
VTIFLDIHIPLDPRHPDAINPASVYLSWVAWSQITAKEQAHRDRLGNALKAALYKQAGWQMPEHLPRIRCENIPATAHMAVRRICRHRLPAVLMVLSQWAERGIFDLSRAELIPQQEQRLNDVLCRRGWAPSHSPR